MSDAQPSSSRPGLGMALRVTAAVALLGVWVGLTSTTRADPADARPGMALSVDAAPESLAEGSAARQLYRLLAATESTQSANDLRATLSESRDLLGLEIPEADAEVDTAHDADDNPVKFATSGLAVSEALVKAGLKAPQDQASRLLVSAALIDDASRATLEANNQQAPKDSGVDAVLGYDERPALTDLVGELTPALPSGLKGTSCDPMADDTERLAKARAGFANDPLAGARAAESRGRAFHAVGAEAGRLAYATRVVGQRQSSTVFLERADDLDGFVEGLQELMPAGCAPVVTSSVGATDALTDPTSTLPESQTALADKTRIAAAAMPVGETRTALAKLWWRLR